MGDRGVNALASPFRRFLSPAFVQALAELTKSPNGAWWRDVLLNRDLILAVRTDSLNVYHRGASIFRVALQDGEPVAETHVKYLVRQRQAYAPLSADGRFQHNPADALWTSYTGPATLREMLSAATSLAGSEKRGLHELIKGSPRVIDVEINLRGSRLDPAEEPQPDAFLEDNTPTATTPTKEGTVLQDRLDAATLEARDGQLWVVFHEAKHFANVELRAGPNRAPKVSEQIQRYRRSIASHADEIKTTYQDVCEALTKLHAMRGELLQAKGVEASPLDPLIARAAEGELLHVDPEPRLIVFGFDKDQREGQIWQRHRERLSKEFGLTVYAIGNPTANAASAFAQQTA